MTNMGRKADVIKLALYFAEDRHKSQVDDDGESYYLAHLLPVADLLGLVTDDKEIIAAGILHDILENTSTTYTELANAFGNRIANLVNEVTHETRKNGQGYYSPRLESQEATMIKFADRLSNISRMSSWPKQRQTAYLRKSRFWDNKE